MKMKIKDIKPGLIKGVDISFCKEKNVYKEKYFAWEPSDLLLSAKTNEISGGILKSWHHTPEFTELEYHCDDEMFYFISGIAIMLFIDINDGKPDMDSAQVVRIPAGTQIVLKANKGHFVAVAEDSETSVAIVVSPKMDAPRIALPEIIIGEY